ncbi:DNA-binding domain-containing protein [Pseudoalteromonas sp. OOF1S-7]|uniref:HvfC/BufC N-terminal domain-containing protein n=1 Tax=Pseudoalteromonas sp. OOF1S-7 TaxID=2917757 RepID=UPI001EF55253|nr:DNA-binding domain-containing protein [Pseudoalteromonas sp. OOF1S-7]MCG7537545.1 DNA-binding domain-containing protein [Pseudoalteromonas sp. OOF1S-7]
MADLAKLQQAFIDMLNGAASDLTNHIAPQPGLDAKDRAAIYHNAYRIRLTKVLEQDHEMLGRYLGDDLFDQLVEGYLAQYPSCDPSLRHFGDRLPTFLAHQPPFSAHGILSEMALFERLLLQAFDAPDDTRLTIQALQQVPANLWPNVMFTLHPSVRLLCCQFAAVESWQALKQADTPPQPELPASRYWLIVREMDLRTAFHPLSHSDYVCLKAISDGLPFSFVCEAAARLHQDTETGTHAVMQLLQKALNAGWLSQYTLPVNTPDQPDKENHEAQ